jgi:DNA-directed RNA polymerase subunit RPC12/RpoP
MSSDWQMWYPCTECGSTTLEQTVEEELTLSVNEQGHIVGEDFHGEDNHVECRECGKVLLE